MPSSSSSLSGSLTPPRRSAGTVHEHAGPEQSVVRLVELGVAHNFRPQRRFWGAGERSRRLQRWPPHSDARGFGIAPGDPPTIDIREFGISVVHVGEKPEPIELVDDARSVDRNKNVSLFDVILAILCNGGHNGAVHRAGKTMLVVERVGPRAEIEAPSREDPENLSTIIVGQPLEHDGHWHTIRDLNRLTFCRRGYGKALPVARTPVKDNRPTAVPTIQREIAGKEVRGSVATRLTSCEHPS